MGPYNRLMRKPTIIFDFDGTIADTQDLAIEIYNLVAPEYKLKPVLPADIPRIREMNIREILTLYKISFWKIPKLLIRGKRELHDRIADIKPIAGIHEVLDDLHAQGYSLGVMTSNTKKNVIDFLDNNNLDNVFDFIHSEKNLFKKDKALKRLLKSMDIAQESVYVGDEMRDIQAAKQASIPIISVSWGFNTKASLQSLGPNAIADKPLDLGRCVKEIFV